MSHTELELRWRPMALAEREAILNHIAEDNVQSAIELDEEFFLARRPSARSGP